MKLAAALTLCYLVGSLSPSYILVYLVRGSDLRTLGTGNLGARNVMRVLGWRWGVLTALLDIVKGFVPVWIVMQLYPEVVWVPLAAMTMVLLGHNYSLFLRGSGGKGLASGFGAGLAYSPAAILLTLGAGLMVLLLTRRPYLTALVFAFSFPIIVWLLHGYMDALAALPAALVVLSRHLKHFVPTH